MMQMLFSFYMLFILALTSPFPIIDSILIQIGDNYYLMTIDFYKKLPSRKSALFSGGPKMVSSNTVRDT